MSKIKIVNYTFKIKNKTILDNINISFEDNKIYGLKGINGSGKTMLMRAILGLIRPKQGEIYIDNTKIKLNNKFPNSVGFLIENPSFLGSYSGFKNLEFIYCLKNKFNREKIENALNRVGLDKAVWKKKYRTYSLGMKQRLAIACAIMEEPNIIILDEPMNALDESGVDLIKKILIEEKERGALVILSCHDNEILKEMSDEIIEIKEGKVESKKE